MNSYKLVQFLKTYVGHEKEEIPIMIQLRTARNWLRKLRYKYKDLRKDVFIDKHKQSDVIEDRKNFLYKMEELNRYIVKFDKNSAIKPKVYPADCVVGGNNSRPVIVITYDWCTFSANNEIYEAWT